MKKIIFLILLIPTFLFAQDITVPSDSAFNTDETEFFVSGNALNDSLEQVNFLLCFMANTKPASFVNSSKPYVKLSFFMNRCSAPGPWKPRIASVFMASGEPSTWCPLERLVQCMLYVQKYINFHF